MASWVSVVALLWAVLGGTRMVAAQEMPAGGYFADGAYYVPVDAQGPGDRRADGRLVPSLEPSACPPGQYGSYPGVPTIYVAQSATMVRIYQYSPFSGEPAPGFPYVPVYPATSGC